MPPRFRERGLEIIDEDMGTATKFIQTAVLRLSVIIDALLRLSRAGRVELQRERVEVDALVDRIVGSMRSTIEEKGAQVVVGKLPPTSGDATAIEQVFANLIGNALNYLDDARPGRIEVGTVEALEEAHRELWLAARVHDPLNLPG